MNENLVRGYLAEIISARQDILVQRVENDPNIPTEGILQVICLRLIAHQKDYRALQDQHQIDSPHQVCPVNPTWT